MTDPNSPDAPQPGSTPPPPPPPTEAAPTEVMPATPPPPGAVGAEPGAAAGGAVPPGQDPDAPGEADDETPWYKTPLGIAALVLGALLLVALLIWLFWGGGDDDDEAEPQPGIVRVVLNTVDPGGEPLDRGFLGSVDGPADSPKSFIWILPTAGPGSEDRGSTTGDDGEITFAWEPDDTVADPAAWASSLTLVENAPAGFTPPGPTVDCVLQRTGEQNTTISMTVVADPPDTSVDQVVTYTFPNYRFLPGDLATCDLVSELPPPTTSSTTTTTTTTTTTVAPTTVAPTTVAPTTEAPTTAAPTTAAPPTVAPTTPPSQPATAIEALTDAGNFGSFLAAVNQVPSVQALLEGAGPVTVFAPNDDAFDGVTPPADPADLEQLLLSHVVDGSALLAADVAALTEVDVASGGVQPVDADANPISIGGAGVVGADTLSDNGVSHELDAIMPAVGS